MRRWLGPGFAVLLTLGAAAPAVSADDPDFKNLHPNAGQGVVQPVAPVPADAGDKPEKPAPTFAYFVAVAATIIVLSIICVPSRKADSATSHP